MDTTAPSSETIQEEIEKKKPDLNQDAFYGRANHNEVLKKLLSEIKPVKFSEVIGLIAEKDLKQKHYVFAVVKEILRMADDHKWNLRKVYEYAYIYNGAFWKQCSKDAIKTFLAEAAVKMGMPDYEAKHYEFADKLLKQFLCEAHLQTQEQVKDKILINLHNGTFEFVKDGFQKRDFNSEDFLTYQLQFDFDDTAVCPMFENYLLKVLPDESSRKILQEFSGYIFTNLNLEKCLVLTGNGGNGKSVFMNIICALLGKENILQYSLGLFGHEYNRAKLTDVLLNYSGEKGFDLTPDTFKALISGEPLQAREIYQKPFTLYNKAKFITNCNELPKETESTEAYFRRFLIVPFDVTISEYEKDISLAEKIITKELPGIFNWVLIGLNRILKQKKFTYCEKAEKALGEFRKQSDSVQLFVDENNYFPSTNWEEALSDLYHNYKNFCSDDGYKPVGKNKFSMRLERKGFIKKRKSVGNYFGIEKKKDEEKNVF